ncbi:MAG TPA: hypothetical protein VF433_14820 [Cellvibrio sp.]
MKNLFIIVAALAMLNLSTTSFASDCAKWQSKLKSTQRNIDNGGNQSQVRQWVKERDYYARTLERCHKKAGTHRWVEATGNSTRPLPSNKPARGKREKPRAMNTENPQLQQAIATCNYWIDQYNSNASPANHSFKTTACRHADQAQQMPAAEITEAFTPSRSLKACVKPNNRIDDEVKRCMQGKTEPIWRSNN